MPLGMNIPVPAPRPAARVWATAITTYVALEGPEYERDAKSVKRWLNGIKFTPFGCDKIAGAPFDPCAERTTEYQTMGEEVLFDPFLAEVGVECSTLGLEREALAEYVIAHTEVSRSSIMAAQVERAAFTTTNPSLASEAAIISNADQSLLGALAAVEDALADLLDGGSGMIHMPASFLAILQASGGLRYDVDNKPYTATGHLIVADAGYLGVSPTTETVVEGEVWIYGSGPVFAKYDDELASYVGIEGSDIDLTRNERFLDAEVYGIAIFDPCPVVAAKVDTSDADIVGQETTALLSDPTVTRTAPAEGAIAADKLHGFRVHNAHATDAVLIYIRIGDEATDTPFAPLAVAAGQSVNVYDRDGEPIAGGSLYVTDESAGDADISDLVGYIITS